MNELAPPSSREGRLASARRIWQKLWSHAIDEAIGLLIVRFVYRHRRHSPVPAEPFYENFEGLLTGELEQFFQPPPAAVDLWEHKQLRKQHGGQSIWDFEFPSPVKTASSQNSRVRGRMWTEAPSTQCVVGVDGVVQYHANWFARLADRLTPAGIDVVMMDAPFNFRRTPRGYRPGELILSGDLEHQLAVSRQAILDLWTLVHNLQKEGREVGLVGISFGGWMALMTSLLADELAFVSAMAPPVDMERLLEEGGTIVRALRRGLGHGPLAEETLRRAVKAVTPKYWTPRLPGGRIHLYAAEHDRFVPTSRIRELAGHWGTRFSLHPTGHMGLTQKSRYIDLVADEILGYWD